MVEKKKTLNDKISKKTVNHHMTSFDIKVFYESDVKDTIKELKKNIKNRFECTPLAHIENEFKRLIDEVFGEELTK